MQGTVPLGRSALSMRTPAVTKCMLFRPYQAHPKRLMRATEMPGQAQYSEELLGADLPLVSHRASPVVEATGRGAEPCVDGTGGSVQGQTLLVLMSFVPAPGHTSCNKDGWQVLTFAALLQLCIHVMGMRHL